MTETFELFHQVSDTSSARVRRYIVERELEPHIRFRNIAYEEVRADLKARGATEVPALWNGSVFVTGADAIIARLQAFSDVGRE